MKTGGDVPRTVTGRALPDTPLPPALCVSISAAANLDVECLDAESDLPNTDPDALTAPCRKALIGDGM